VTETWESAEGFRLAVEQATRAATQEVAKRTRWRTTLAALLVGVIVGCGVAIPVVLVLSHGATRQNCESISELAKLGGKRVARETAAIAVKRKRTEDFKTKSHDRLGLSESDFDKLIAEQEAETATEAQEAQERQAVYERIKRHNCG